VKPSVTVRYRTDHGGLWPHHSGGDRSPSSFLTIPSPCRRRSSASRAKRHLSISRFRSILT